MSVNVTGLPGALRDHVTELLGRARYREAADACDGHLDRLPEASRAEQCLEVASLWLDLAPKHRALRYAEMALVPAPADPRALAVRLDCLAGEYRWYEAIEAARQAVSRCPGDPGLWLKLADLLTAANLRLEALEAASRGLAHDPGHAGLRLSHARTLLGLHRYPEAAAAFAGLPGPEVARAYLGHGRYEEALAALDAAEPAHLAVLLDCLTRAGRRPDAEAAARDAAARHPADPAVHLALAWFHLDRNAPRDALDAAGRVLELRPADKEATLLRARSLIRLRLTDEARLAAEAVLRQPDPDDRLDLVLACESEERLDDALRYCDLILAEFPWHADTLRQRAFILRDRGERRAAKAAARRAIRLRPEDDDLRDCLVIVHGSYHDESRRWRRWTGLRLAERALRVGPGNPERQDDRLWLLRKLGRLRRAEAVARTLIAAHPDAYRYLCDVADAYAERGSRGRAIRLLGQLPERRDLALRRAEILLKLNRPIEAEYALAFLAESDGQDPETLLELGGVFFMSRHEEHALPYLERAVDLDPRFSAAHATRIDCFWDMHWYDAAERAARDAVTHLPEDLSLWTRLVTVSPPDRRAAVVDEALTAFPGSRQAEALAELANALEKIGEVEDAVRLRDRSLQLASDDGVVEAQAAALRSLDRYGAARRLLRGHPGTSGSLARAMRELNADLGMHALVAAGFGESPGLTRAERAQRRRSRWRSGGPVGRLRRARRDYELQVLWRWENWTYNLALLGSLDGLTRQEAEVVRAENENYLLAWARQALQYNLVRDAAVAFAPVLAVGAAGAAALGAVGWVWPGEHRLLAFACVALAALVLAPLRRRTMAWHPWAGVTAALAGLGALALWRGLPLPGLFLLALVTIMIVHRACVQAVHIWSDIRFRLLRRRHPRASILNDLLELLLRVSHLPSRNSLVAREDWAYWLERAASSLGEDLPRKLRAEDPDMQRWVARNAKAAACAVRRLKRQALSPAPGSIDILLTELRRAASAVATGQFARLRLVSEPEQPRRGWLSYVQGVARSIAVMGLPVLAVVALGPVLGLEGDAYRTALLVSAGWAAFYLLLSLDPGLREKVDTARSLLSASSAPGKPDDQRTDRPA
ncbi:hypothetical protein [Nonomuraea sp. NPDC048916]|uniref:hypothetical protein n=1 Tax=Nonomuraea sp. NPDC048916 TaxID=3154232 RepID=UPI0034003FE2